MFLSRPPEHHGLLAELPVDGGVEPEEKGEGNDEDEDEVKPHNVHLT